MSPIRRILVAIKNPAARAPVLATKAVQIARAHDAEIELFHALTNAVYVDALTARDPAAKAFEGAEAKRAADGLEKIAARLRRHGVRVTTRATWDYPAAEAIVRRATTMQADLIVVGRHQGKHTMAWLLGLTDWNVLHSSPVPVLLVKNARLYRHPNVLAAIDPSHAYAKPAQLDGEILGAARDFTAAMRGKLHAMHAAVASSYLMPAGIDVASAGVAVRLQRDAERDSRAHFDEALEASGIPSTRRHFVDGHPVDAIPAVVKRTKCNVLAMGAISRSGLKRLFIGNTAERILDRVTCDVLVVKPPHFRSKVSRQKRGVHFVAAPLSAP